jgi:hypothetical protein
VGHRYFPEDRTYAYIFMEMKIVRAFFEKIFLFWEGDI